MQNDDAQPPPRAPREVVLPDRGGWVSGPCLPACGRCGQPRPDDGNDWCQACEDEDAAAILAALREDEDGQ